MATVLPESTKHTPVCYAYSRVSTIGQAEVGMSLGDQKDRLEGYYHHALKPTGVLWGDLYVDAGVSAAKIPFCDRKAGRLIWERVRPGDHVIMTALDRGFRRLRDASRTIAEWTEKGIHVHFLSLGLATNTPTGRLVLHVLAAIAEFQRDILVEGTKMGLARRKELTGTYNGRCPIGYKIIGTGNNSRVIPDLYAKSVGTRVRQMADDGMSVEAIYADLYSRRLMRRGTTPWKLWALKTMLQRSRLEQWTEPPITLPPVIGPVTSPIAVRRVKRKVAATPNSFSNQPENCSSEIPGTGSITVSAAMPSPSTIGQ